MSQGLDLTRATVVCWYAPIDKAETYRFKSAAKNSPITKSDVSERFFGKKTELSCGFGIGANTSFRRFKGEGVALAG
jgi:hypothetical protein